MDCRLLSGVDNKGQGQGRELLDASTPTPIPTLTPVDSIQEDKNIVFQKYSESAENTSSHANKHIAEVINRDFDNYDGKVRFVSDGAKLTSESLRREGFSSPYIITDPNMNSIGLKMPNRLRSLMDLANIVGYSFPLSLMDCTTQQEVHGWTMSSMACYFERRKALKKLCGDGKNGSMKTSKDEQLQVDRVFNQISMEFSKTPLIKKVVSPQIVRDLDWIDVAWSKTRRNKDDYPRVQYYCLTSTAGCYTDFRKYFLF